MKDSTKKQTYAGGNKLSFGVCLIIFCVAFFKFQLLSSVYNITVLLPIFLGGIYLYLSGFQKMLKEKGYSALYICVLAPMNLIGLIILAALPDKH